MKPTLKGLLPLVFLTVGSFAAAQESIVVDFEQFPVKNPPVCPELPYDRGASFGGGLIRDGDTRVYRSTGAGDISIGYKLTVTVPSSGVRKISIEDHCNYYGSSGCTDVWRFAIDNVTFKPDKPCLSISGPSDVEPNPAGATTKNIPVVVEVTDCEGNTLSNVAVETSVTVDFTSGGHLLNHAVPLRPLGGLRDDTSGANGPGDLTIARTSNIDGQILLQFVPPEVSGRHTINAECVDFKCNAPDPLLDVEVKIDGLAPIPPANVFYTLTEYLPGTTIGKNIGDNGYHNGVNHNLTPEASDILWRVAFNYAFLLNFQPVPERLHVNDASLPKGGLFDIRGLWTPNHRGHRKGTVVDIRANESPGAVPPLFDRHFARAAADLGAVAVREFANQSPRNINEHYHLRLLGADQ